MRVVSSFSYDPGAKSAILPPLPLAFDLEITIERPLYVLKSDEHSISLIHVYYNS